MSNLFECSVHSWDIKLFQKLGLKVFKDIPLQKWVKLGCVKVDKERDENQVAMGISVLGMPAQFWKFTAILKNKYNNKKQKITLETGSGCFADYWKKLYPLFRGLAEGMITIKT